MRTSPPFFTVLGVAPALGRTPTAAEDLMGGPPAVVRCDPDVLGGTPVMAGTRVPAKSLLDYLAAGDSLDRFLDHFPSVTRKQAVKALEVAKDLLAAISTTGAHQGPLMTRAAVWCSACWTAPA